MNLVSYGAIMLMHTYMYVLCYAYIPQDHCHAVPSIELLYNSD
jgi:hypothetical protein